MTALPIIVTMGDPAGVGPELIGRAHQAMLASGAGRFIALADPDLLAARFRATGQDIALSVIDNTPHIRDSGVDGSLSVLPLRTSTDNGQAGTPNPDNAPAIIEAIERAVGLVHDGKARAIVTAPIAKDVLQAAGFIHPGHTEFLGALAAQHWGGNHQPVMMLVCDDLKVVPVTVHIALNAVSTALTPARLSLVAKIVAEELKARFGIERPRLAVAGLNPHAGENGRMGHEDRDIIAPVISALRGDGFDITGPLPPDTMFHQRARATYDAALCMYHDQALIPVKTLAFDEAVNVTLGLPFVRTSPDHGTAFDIAGKGIARPDSLIAAIRLADQLSRRS